MSRKSTQIAIGGVFSALCILLMFLTGLIPFATYALPALAGAMLIAVVVENGCKTAMLVYCSVSLLSLFVVPDREAAAMFIAFFGYYPVAKEKLERLGSRFCELLLKFLLFNATMIAAYWILIQVLGMTDLMEDLGDFGRYGPWILLAIGNVIFAVYDFALTRYISIYVNWFKPTFLRR